MLILLRGCPGAGKSTLAEHIATKGHDVVVIAADDYFTLHGLNFNGSLLPKAHEWCLKETKSNLKLGYTVLVTNTFTQEWEMEKYFALAKELNIMCHTVIVENRHGNKSVHDVPDQTIQKMKLRFDIKL